MPPLLNRDYESDSDDEEDPPTKNSSPSTTNMNAPPKPPLPPRAPPIPLSQPPGLPPKPKAIPDSPKDNNKVKISLQNKIGQRIDGKMLGKYELCPENISMFIPEPQEAPQNNYSKLLLSTLDIQTLNRH